MLPRDNRYRPEVILLMDVLPLVAEERCFALKGGTAINLFVRDMPRLSVDLDLVFPDHTQPRDEALPSIEQIEQELMGDDANEANADDES